MQDTTASTIEIFTDTCDLIVRLFPGYRKVMSYSAAIRATTAAPPTETSGHVFAKWLLVFHTPATDRTRAT